MSGLLQWIADNPWVAWASAGLLLAVAELVSLDLVLLMLAVGAFAGAATDLVAPTSAALLVAAVVSVGMLYLVRPEVVRKLHAAPSLSTGHAALIGRPAVVTATITREGGQVRLSGEVWTARPYDPDLVIEAGTAVSVYEIDGATAVVYPND